MRINARIATASDHGVSRFPTIPDEEVVGPDGHLDEAKARRLLSSDELIVWASDDDHAVMAFAIEFLSQLKNVVQWMNAQPDVDVKYATADTKLEKRCARKLEQVRYCYARVEIRHRGGEVTAKVSWSNPQDIVGVGAYKIPKDFALLCVNILLCISDEVKKRGGIGIRVIEGENCEGYIAEARAINARNDLELKVRGLIEKRAACPNRVGEYCSPAYPGCENLKAGGKCMCEDEIRGAWLKEGAEDGR